MNLVRWTPDLQSPRFAYLRISKLPRNFATSGRVISSPKEWIRRKIWEMTTKPLDGCASALDISNFMAGPFCATRLAEFGAGVIKG